MVGREGRTLPLWSHCFSQKDLTAVKQRDGADSLGRVRTGSQPAGMF